MKNTKRIHSIKIKKMIDESPDTSWLGDYSNRPDSEFSIDRAHSEDCASLEVNHVDIVDKLENIIKHLNDWRTTADENDEETLSAAIALCIEKQDEAMECNCSQGGSIDSRELRYFNGPVGNYKGLPDAEIRKYVRQDYERMESLNRGDWHFIGIRAEAEIQIGDNVQHITSGGLWGVESDADASYLAEVISDESSNLKDQLKALGFSTRAISKAFKEREED